LVGLTITPKGVRPLHVPFPIAHACPIGTQDDTDPWQVTTLRAGPTYTDPINTCTVLHGDSALVRTVARSELKEALAHRHQPTHQTLSIGR
jgi:hypothetical protein